MQCEQYKDCYEPEPIIITSDIRLWLKELRKKVDSYGDNNKPERERATVDSLDTELHTDLDEVVFINKSTDSKRYSDTDIDCRFKNKQLNNNRVSVDSIGRNHQRTSNFKLLNETPVPEVAKKEEAIYVNLPFCYSTPKSENKTQNNIQFDINKIFDQGNQNETPKAPVRKRKKRKEQNTLDDSSTIYTSSDDYLPPSYYDIVEQDYRTGNTQEVIYENIWECKSKQVEFDRVSNSSNSMYDGDENYKLNISHKTRHLGCSTSSSDLELPLVQLDQEEFVENELYCSDLERQVENIKFEPLEDSDEIFYSCNSYEDNCKFYRQFYGEEACSSSDENIRSTTSELFHSTSDFEFVNKNDYLYRRKLIEENGESDEDNENNDDCVSLRTKWQKQGHCLEGGNVENNDYVNINCESDDPDCKFLTYTKSNKNYTSLEERESIYGNQVCVRRDGRLNDTKIIFAEQVVDETVNSESTENIRSSMLVNEYNIVCLTEKAIPRKNSISSNILDWSSDLLDNYENEPEFVEMEETSLLGVPGTYEHKFYDSKSATASPVQLRKTDRLTLSAPKREPSKSFNAYQNIYNNITATDKSTTDSGLTIKLEGSVSRSKLVDGHKKSCKKWSNCYALLTNNALYIFKSKKDVDKMKSGAKGPYEQHRLDLKLGSLNKDNVQKKNTLLITDLATGGQIQITTEGKDDILNWQDEIENVMEKLNNKRPLTIQISDSSSERSKDHIKIKNKLKNFFGGRRPSVEELVKSGIYKDEPIFGSDLETICFHMDRPQVPLFVKYCIKAIEVHIKTDGLYRASGNLSQIQKIRLQVDQNNYTSLCSILEDGSNGDPMNNGTDIHVLTGALKLFFRELKISLIPGEEFTACVEAACNANPVPGLRAIVKRLPPAHIDTLKALLEHLVHVSEYGSENRMDTSNLATVWAPSMMQPPMGGGGVDVLYQCSVQMRVVEAMLSNYHKIFDDIA